MKKSKFTAAQIIFAIKQAETGVSVAEVCRKMGILEATCYNWKKKYGGLGVSELRKLRRGCRPRLAFMQCWRVVVFLFIRFEESNELRTKH